MLSACALLFAEPALATGMDCTKAASAVEKTICASTALYTQDIQMAGAYRALINANPQAQPELKQAQRSWLKTRDQCVDNQDCLSQSYRERVQSLQKQLSEAIAYKPLDVDKSAAQDLRQAIRTASNTDAEFALERTLESLSIKTGITDFSDVEDEGASADEAHFPKTVPKGVTQDEWKALTGSKIDGASESGKSDYTLMDLNGDGRRDLIVVTYAGGTGLFSYIETYHRAGDVFVRRTHILESESSSASYLLSLNARGANQSVNWINLHGRVYAAYRNSHYGVDELYLLNPLEVTGTVPIVTAHYRYELSVPKTQKDETSDTNITLDDDLHNALTQALGKVSKTEANDVGEQKEPLCPIPPSGEGDGAYYGYGPGHYTFEIVGDMPVVIGGQCYIGRMMDWFGGYSAKDGLEAQLVLRKPDREETERSYQVKGKRRLTDVVNSLDSVEGDNGG